MRKRQYFLVLFAMCMVSGSGTWAADPKFDNYLATVRELLPVDGTLMYDHSSMQGYRHWGQGNRFELFHMMV